MGAGIAAGPHCPRSYGPPKHSAVPGIGFRPRPCGLGRFPFGFPSKAEAPSRSPGRSIKANFNGTLSGSPPEQALMVSRETGHRTEVHCLLFPVTVGANSAGFRSGAEEANFAGSLSRFLRPKAPVPLDARRKVGSVSACASASRFFLKAPDLPASSAFPKVRRCRSGPLPFRLSLRFRRNRLPGRIRTMAAPTDSRKRNLPVDNGDNGDKISTRISACTDPLETRKSPRESHPRALRCLRRGALSAPSAG